MSLSDAWENLLQNHIWRGVALTFPATYYAALFTAAPGEAGGGTEVPTTGYGYARVGVARSTGAWNAAVGGLVDNAAAITFAQATANYPAQVVAVGIFDAATAGVLVAYSTFTGVTVLSGQTPRINTGALDLTLA